MSVLWYGNRDEGSGMRGEEDAWAWSSIAERGGETSEEGAVVETRWDGWDWGACRVRPLLSVVAVVWVTDFILHETGWSSEESK